MLEFVILVPQTPHLCSVAVILQLSQESYRVTFPTAHAATAMNRNPTAVIIIFFFIRVNNVIDLPTLFGFRHPRYIVFIALLVWSVLRVIENYRLVVFLLRDHIRQYMSSNRNHIHHTIAPWRAHF